MRYTPVTGARFPHLLRAIFLTFVSLPLAAQQFPVCIPSAGNGNLRSESIAESAPDITLSCSGAKPNVAATASVSILTTVNITNHLSTGNVPDVAVSVMAGGFQQPVPANIQLVGNNQLNISGIQYTPGQDGGLTVRISNLRLDVHAAAASKAPLLTANITSTGLVLAATQIQLGVITAGLLASQTTAGLFGTGGPPPQPLTMQGLFTAGTAFDTTRVTEGFANAFMAKDAVSDTGTRIMLKYSNIPPTMELIVPDLIAGSSAIQQTSAGDLGVPQSAGVYAPSATGSLLLARVGNANPDGSGGGAVFKPNPNIPQTVNLSSATALQVSNGSAFVVYEVVDSNPLIQESAQIQTFVALTSNTAPGNYGGISISLAPVSTVETATMTDPVPRFAAVAPPGDCTVLGDCSASYFPRLKLNTTSINLQAPANGTVQVGYLPFINSGSGTMAWNASVSYQNGSGWLSLSTTSGVNNATIGVRADPTSLAPGTYNAMITIDAGPAAGSQSVPVVFQIGPSVPLVSLVANAANGNVTSLVPGSFAAVYGTGLAGTNVSVSFDGAAATLTYTSATQINLLVPSSLGGKTSAMMLVSVDGRSGSPVNVNLASAAPAIFPSGVLNQDNSVNSINKPAARGSILQIFVTGLPLVSGATVNISNRTLQSVYSGGAPGVPGLQQVNVMLPADLTGTAQLMVCTSGTICTPAFNVTIQ